VIWLNGEAEAWIVMGWATSAASIEEGGVHPAPKRAIAEPKMILRTQDPRTRIAAPGG